MLKSKQLGEAIKRAIDLKIASGAISSKADVARHFGIKPPSIHDWINKGSISKDKLPELWRYFSDVVGMEHWGVTGSDADFANEMQRMQANINGSATMKVALSNTEPGPDIRGKVPLISWVQAGAFCNAVDLFEPGMADDWIPAVQALGPYAYALRVVGDSMTAPHGLSYPEGIIIFVDPDYPITNGCRVIAKLPHAEEATFKVYSEDAGQKFLKPLNPQYPMIPITHDMRLCGVVRGAYRPE